jgi:hypothetical protein
MWLTIGGRTNIKILNEKTATLSRIFFKDMSSLPFDDDSQEMAFGDDFNVHYQEPLSQKRKKPTSGGGVGSSSSTQKEVEEIKKKLETHDKRLGRHDQQIKKYDSLLTYHEAQLKSQEETQSLLAQNIKALTESRRAVPAKSKKQEETQEETPKRKKPAQKKKDEPTAPKKKKKTASKKSEASSSSDSSSSSDEEERKPGRHRVPTVTLSFKGMTMDGSIRSNRDGDIFPVPDSSTRKFYCHPVLDRHNQDGAKVPLKLCTNCAKYFTNKAKGEEVRGTPACEKEP